MPERFTEGFIKGLQPPAKGSRWEWDGELTGFLVRVFAPTRTHPEGARTFYLSYWLKSEHRYRIGSWPDWSVTAAREEAKAIRKRVDRGEDPATERRELRDAPTMQDLWDRYRTEHLPRKAPRSQRDDQIMIERHILPIIGKDRRVAEVHHGDIVALHGVITAGNGPVRANRILTCASKMFSLSLKPMAGEQKAWRDQAMGNPCRAVPRNPEEPKDRFFCEAELAAISDALAAVGRTSAADCIRFIMLTGCRPSEAILTAWRQLDVEPGYWVKPSSHTKQRKTHRVPLNPAAQELIQRLRKARNADSQPTDYIFPGLRKGKPLQQLRTCWIRSCSYATVSLWESSDSPKVAKVVTDLSRTLRRRPTVRECRAEAERRKIALPANIIGSRVYDLRHSFASIGAGGGLSLPIIGKLLGHTTSRSTMRYAHLADDPLKEATERIGAVIAGAGNGGNVVKLRRA